MRKLGHKTAKSGPRLHSEYQSQDLTPGHWAPGQSSHTILGCPSLPLPETNVAVLSAWTLQVHCELPDYSFDHIVPSYSFNQYLSSTSSASGIFYILAIQQWTRLSESLPHRADILMKGHRQYLGNWHTNEKLMIDHPKWDKGNRIDL
jgi:hypothetical protein